MDIKKHLLVYSLTMVLAEFSSMAHAEINIDKHGDNSLNIEKYGVVLGASRIIYSLGVDASPVSLSVTNNQDYPILVQSRVFDENRKKTAPFIVTPPLFRLNGEQTNSVLITRTGGDFPNNKETMQWLCVKGIPPNNNDLWNNKKNKNEKKRTVFLQISVNDCIKLFVRPSQLKGEASNFIHDVKWSIKGDYLVANNQSAYYMNLSSLVFNGVKLFANYVPPYSSKEFKLPAGAGSNKHGVIVWSIINDLGGNSSKIMEQL
ncbi:MAG: fimbrial biogenesis chaperone [Carnobacterium maltaromaticum]